MKKPAAAHQLLPPSAYTSEAWYTREQQELFSRSSVWVGMLEDFARPGESSITFFQQNLLELVPLKS